MMEDLDEIRETSELLYSALSNMLNGDSSMMEGVWSHSILVTTMHPVGGREIGWDRVRETWDQLARLASNGKVKLENQLIRAEENMAYEVGTERGQVNLAGNLVFLEHRVTNIYRREGSKWKVVHHHTDISPQMQEIFKKLIKA
jgi:ketosteroid isomerase-like protein